MQSHHPTTNKKSAAMKAQRRGAHPERACLNSAGARRLPWGWERIEWRHDHAAFCSDAPERTRLGRDQSTSGRSSSRFTRPTTNRSICIARSSGSGRSPRTHCSSEGRLTPIIRAATVAGAPSRPRANSVIARRSASRSGGVFAPDCARCESGFSIGMAAHDKALPTRLQAGIA